MQKKPESKIYVLAFDQAEAVTSAKARGIHYSRVVYIPGLHNFERFRNETLTVCPGFYKRENAQDVLRIAAQRGQLVRRIDQVTADAKPERPARQSFKCVKCGKISPFDGDPAKMRIDGTCLHCGASA